MKYDIRKPSYGKRKMSGFRKNTEARCAPKFHRWLCFFSKRRDQILELNLCFSNWDLSSFSLSGGHLHTTVGYVAATRHVWKYCMCQLPDNGQPVRCIHHHIQNSVFSLSQKILSQSRERLPYSQKVYHGLLMLLFCSCWSWKHHEHWLC